MVLIIGRNSVEDKVRKEAEARRQTRHTIDVLNGTAKSKGAQRGDFKLARELDKNLTDYNKFKNPEDRKKILNEYEGRQQEYRNQNRDRFLRGE